MKKSDIHCEICGHRAESIFCSLAGAHLEKLDREKIVREYEKGEVAFYEGTPATAIYCVYSGAVKLYKSVRKKETQMLRLLGPGGILGYRALLSNEPYTATAEAVETTVICAITKQVLFDLLKHSQDLTMRLLAKLASELKTSEEQMLAMTRETVRQRTAKLLLFLREGNKHKYKYRSGSPLNVPLMRSEMAQMVGTTPETFSRTLRYLAAKGVLNLTRSEISINNPSALRVMARP
jgi:CRP/FNR family transcriptional regulator, polysaccharide utilization system transcription regulator